LIEAAFGSHLLMCTVELHRGQDDPMKQEINPWTHSSIVLAAAGLAVIGVGLYFIFLRPPLLPEDLRYLALPAAQLDIVKPRLSVWLTHVFTVLGGYAVATGVLTVTLAATSFRARSRAAAVGAAIGVQLPLA
jgi:hypothetical protein